MKRFEPIFSLFLAGIMLLLAACGGANNSPPSTPLPTATSTSMPTTTPTVTPTLPPTATPLPTNVPKTILFSDGTLQIIGDGTQTQLSSELGSIKNIVSATLTGEEDTTEALFTIEPNGEATIAYRQALEGL